MADFLAGLLNVAIQGFAVSSMLAVGLSFTARQILDPLLDVRGVILALLANFVAVPLLAYGVTHLLSLDRSAALGLILVALAAGAPFAVKLVKMAGGAVEFSSGLLVLLLVGTIVYIPLVVPLVAPGATVSPGEIARPLVVTMLLPLGIGLMVKALSPEGAARLQPVAGRIASVLLTALLVLTAVVHFRAILGVFGTGAILAALLVLVGAFGLGYLFGGFGEHLRDEMAQVTAQRNVAAALVVAESLGDPGAVVMITVVSAVSMALLFPLAGALGRRAAAVSRAETDGAPAQRPERRRAPS